MGIMEKTTKGGESPNWLELPEDVTAEILSKVGTIDILGNVQRVCNSWRMICKDPSIWRTIDMYNLGKPTDMYPVLERMCRHAVDRSNGGLVYINLEFFGTDHLFNYIADRCNRLRHFRLSCCSDISGEGFSEALAKLPMLEELDLSFYGSSNLSDTAASEKALTVIDSSCPRLKSLNLNSVIFRPPYKLLYRECDKMALVIAKSMHGLSHLQLCGNELTNFGLEAILDGCPNLESLGLCGCLSLNLEGKLGKRCGESIKDLRFPNEHADEFEFTTIACSKNHDKVRPVMSAFHDSFRISEFVLESHQDYLF